MKNFALSLRRHRLWNTGSAMISFVTTLHMCWAALVVSSVDVTGSTPLATLARVLGDHWLLGFVFFASATLAVFGVVMPKRFLSLACMLPQQMILVIVAWGAGHAVWVGMYPDGTVRWWGFILGDQIAMILMAPAYTLAVLAFHNIFNAFYNQGK